MLKKIFIILAIFLFSSYVLAEDDTADVKAFFYKYINALNAYSSALPSYYSSNAQIIRVVIKPDGTKQSVNVPFDRYIKELNKGKATAKIVGYKNRFGDVQISGSGDNYKITATRYPNRDKTGLSASYNIIKSGDNFKIQTESWDTTVQKFLNEK